MIEHDMRFLFGLADRINVIHWGQVIARGTPAELRDNPWVRALGARRTARDAERRRASTTYYGETQVLFGVSLDGARRRGRRAARAERRRQDDDAALDPRADAGARAARIEFDGRDVTRGPTHEIARAGFGWVPDDRRVFPTLTAARNLSIARKRTRFRAWTDEGRAARSFRRSSTCCRASARTCRAASCRWSSISRALVGAPGPRAVRRAEPGPRAQGRAGRDAHDRQPARARASRRWSSTRTCAPCSTSRTACT